MSGIEIRIAKLFSEHENLVISAIDHVLEYGDQQGLEKLAPAIEACSGTDALLLSRHALMRNHLLFERQGFPMPVVRINWSSAFYYPLSYREGHTQISTTVEEAVSAGAEIVICSLFLENGDEEMEARNVALFSEVVRQKERLGIPLIGECYVVEHAEVGAEVLHAKVKRVVRVMAELGADLIKCFYTGERFHEVVQNCPVPVFTIGAEKLANDVDVLKKAEASINAGARGIIFGRNIFMAADPQKIIDALHAVTNGGMGAIEAASRYGLV